MRARASVALVAFVTAIVTANYLTSEFGMVSVGFGLTATAGTFAAGLALLFRDALQEVVGWKWTVVGILAGAALTLIVSPALALASAVAFLLAELADMAVYTPMRRRGWAKAVVASNTVGAAVDTFIFLWLAGFPVTASGVGGQLLVKLAWVTAIPLAAILAFHALRRHSVQRAG